MKLFAEDFKFDNLDRDEGDAGILSVALDCRCGICIGEVVSVTIALFSFSSSN
jgi:hypothetical protein